MSTIIIDVDTSNVEAELAATEQNVKNANLAMISAIRQTAQAGVLVLQIAGVAIDQLFSLYIESALVGIEVIARVSAATSIATFGLTGFLMVGQLVAMLLLIKQVRAKQTETAHQTQAAVQLLRMGTYR